LVLVGRFIVKRYKAKREVVSTFWYRDVMVTITGLSVWRESILYVKFISFYF
jgi:hypothetical protein